MSAVLLGLVMLPAVVGAGLGLAHAFTPQDSTRAGVITRLAAPVSLVTAAVTAGLTVLATMQRRSLSAPFLSGVPGGDLALSVDDLSALVLPTVAVVGLLVLAFAAVEIEEAPARFHGLMLLFLAAALLTVVADTLVTLLLAWEVMGATSWALIGFHWRQDRRVSSGIVAFTVTRFADLGLYLAAGAALAGGAGLALADLPAASEGWRLVLAGGIAVAALGKAAQLPFAFWLARAMDGPSPVSALLHSAAMVAMGGYLLLRTAPTLAAAEPVATIVAWVGALTAVLMGLVALVQTDLKQVLAASTSAQLGFVVLGAGVLAVDGGAVHLVAHAAVKALLFLVAGAWLTALGTRSLLGVAGAAGRWPLLGGLGVVGLLALAGVPPLALWATKDTVLAGAREHGLGLYAVGLAAAGIATAYAVRVLLLVWREAPAGAEAALDEEQPGTRDVPRAALVPLVPLAVGAVVLGLLALEPVGPGLHLDGLAIAGGVVALGLLVVLLVDRRSGLHTVEGAGPSGLWHGWLHLERVADLLVVRPVDRLARGVALVDDAVLDGAVEVVAGEAARAARWTASADDAAVDGVVVRVAAALRRAGRWARRPQTGQLHQYYLQSAAAVGAALVVLVVVR